LLHQDGDKIDGMFQRIKNSTGDMNEAFKTTQESAAFRITQAFREILNAGMQLATDVLPPIATGLEVIAPVISDILPYALSIGVAWAAWVVIPPILSGIAIAIIALRAALIETSAVVQSMNWQVWMVVGLVAAAGALATLTGNLKSFIPVIGIVGIEI